MNKLEGTQLSDLVERSYSWNQHKANGHLIAEHYADSDFPAYSRRITQCAERLAFEMAHEGLKLSSARFCRVRHCPMCQWRRSLKWKARAYKAIPVIQQDFPKHRWLFLTLTVKNCLIEELRETLTTMHESFKRLTKLKFWCATGWVKSTEVTRGQDGLAHPHFHCLLMVPPSYFSGQKYLSHAKWGDLWQQVLRIDYKPVVHITAIQKCDNPSVLIPEIFKYQTKVADLAEERDWLLELTEQLQHTRAIAVGGKLRDYFKDAEQPEAIDEVIGTARIEQEPLYFKWSRSGNTYNLDF